MVSFAFLSPHCHREAYDNQFSETGMQMIKAGVASTPTFLPQELDLPHKPQHLLDASAGGAEELLEPLS